MNSAGVLTIMLAMGVFAMVQAKPDSSAGLKVGSKAPSFSLPGSDGKTYKLADLRKKKVVVLAWYPKAFTGG
jgi:thioredoxin-dependent peroxiredoxin